MTTVGVWSMATGPLYSSPGYASAAGSDRRRHDHTLQGYMNIKHRRQLRVGGRWLLAALHDRGPYPALDMVGEAGTAKSTLAQNVMRRRSTQHASIVRPHRAMSAICYCNATGYMLVFDNLSEMPDWLSDTFSPYLHGGGFGTRHIVHRR